jgi:hypothetical protein
MADPLRGNVGDPGVSITYVEDVDGGPPGGDVGDPGGPTTYVKDVNGGPSGRQCRRSGSTHHLCLRCRWLAPL